MREKKNTRALKVIYLNQKSCDQGRGSLEHLPFHPRPRELLDSMLAKGPIKKGHSKCDQKKNLDQGVLIKRCVAAIRQGDESH